MNTAETLVIALALDALLGEPTWLYARIPHPAVMMGRAVGWIDQRFNISHATGGQRRQNGRLAFGALALGALVLGCVLSLLPSLFQAVIAATLLAQRSLVDHVGAVGAALRLSPQDGQRAVARIVSRDTKGMADAAIARSAIESGAENFSDGVIAPMFWFLIAGLPGLFLYKITNTADSMIGYRTERHEDFGRAAARFDDLLNLIPARLSAVLIALTQGKINDWAAIRADAKLHKSPNAGWPESAMARALDVALAGPRPYDGVMQTFPWVHPTGRKAISAPEIEATCRALWRAWGAVFAVVIAIALFVALL